MQNNHSNIIFYAEHNWWFLYEVKWELHSPITFEYNTIFKKTCGRYYCFYPETWWQSKIQHYHQLVKNYLLPPYVHKIICYNPQKIFISDNMLFSFYIHKLKLWNYLLSTCPSLKILYNFIAFLVYIFQTTIYSMFLCSHKIVTTSTFIKHLLTEVINTSTVLYYPFVSHII